MYICGRLARLGAAGPLRATASRRLGAADADAFAPCAFRLWRALRRARARGLVGGGALRRRKRREVGRERLDVGVAQRLADRRHLAAGVGGARAVLPLLERVRQVIDVEAGEIGVHAGKSVAVGTVTVRAGLHLAGFVAVRGERVRALIASLR